MTKKAEYIGDNHPQVYGFEVGNVYLYRDFGRGVEVYYSKEGGTSLAIGYNMFNACFRDVEDKVFKKEGRLQHITFTGIDWKTDLNELSEIQEQYPYVEWGVLVSKNWKSNDNRYFNPTFLESIDSNLNLSAHMCGHIAREAVNGNLNPFLSWANDYNYIFKRCQLNISGSQTNPEKFIYRDNMSDYFDEVILQQKGVDNCDLFMKSMSDRHVSILLDASGGNGINTDIKLLDVPAKVGYAGGINASNVAEKLTYLEENCKTPYWIDMEAGVRTNDWFDTNKVRQVLEICDPIINKQK